MYLSRFLASLVLYSLTSAAAIAVAEPELEDRSIINGLNCLLSGVVILVQDLVGDSSATPFCQSVLGYTTSTVRTTSTTTTSVTTTAFIATGTATSVVTTITANPVTALPVVSTVTADPTTITTCSNAAAKRQIGITIGAGATSAAGAIGVTLSLGAVPTPTELAGSSPSRISVVCYCLGPPTPSPVTSTATQTAVRTITQNIAIITTASETAYYTPTVTPTTTETCTPTSTVNFCTPPPGFPDTSCGNLGMEFAVYAVTEHSEINSPSWLSNRAPVGNSTDYPAILAGSYTGTCYGATLPINMNEVQLDSCEWWAFVHRGFVYAGTAGAYRFTVPAGTDDTVWAWIGGNARAYFDGENANIVQTLGSTVTQFYTYQAKAGEYIPVRIQLSQVTGYFAHYFTITGPDGAVILDGSRQTDAVVQYGCNGATLPWLPWGAEIGPG